MRETIILQGITKDELVSAVSAEMMRQIKDLLPKADDDPNKLMSRKESAAYLGITTRTLDNMTEKGELKYSKFRSVVRFRRSELDAYILRKEVNIKKRQF